MKGKNGKTAVLPGFCEIERGGSTGSSDDSGCNWSEVHFYRSNFLKNPYFRHALGSLACQKSTVLALS